MRRLSAVFLAAALTLTAACSGGDKDSGGSDGPARKLFQPAGVVGPDSFAPTFAVASYDVDPATLTSGDVSGGAPGLYAGRTYGGSGANICDVEAMIRFLTYYEDRGRAWAAIQGIAFEELESYLRSLTPVFALQNLNVQMFGFKNGQSYGYDAVIAAGTAILVDDEGMPRARCACGNPLLGPSEDAPEGTDIPPTTDEGNPETQDSVPGDSVPEDSVPQDSVPEISIPEDPECPEEFQGARYTDANGVEWVWTGDAPEEFGTAMWFDEATGEMKATTDLDPAFAECDGPDQPRTQEEPECPDWNSDPIRYTDPSGMVWEYDRINDTWYSTTDPDLFKVSTEELPGYLELCDEPEQRTPQYDCPTATLIGWEPNAFIDDNGDVWYWDLVADGWVNDATGDVAQLEEIPGYLERCTDPPGTFQPECPEPFNGVAAMDWTPYLASDGDLWIYDWPTETWVNQNTSETVAGYDPSAIPGYLEDCGTPPTEDDPCPPVQPSVGDSWIDLETGEVWVYSISPGRDGQPTTVVWRNTSSGEERTAGELYSDECGEPTTGLKTVCPPTKPAIDQVWIDSTGEKWVFASGSGGAPGWDQVSTTDIETLTYGELPNKPSGCPEPRRQYDCPPILDVPDGTIWFGFDGDIYRYSSVDGGWVNESDPAAPVIAYTVLLPGYRKTCLPPCPPLNILQTNEFAVWVDPSNGDVWVRWPGESLWTNTTTGETLARTLDLPFYAEDCLPPCDPEAEGGNTYVTNENGIPETNEDIADSYGDSDDEAVTVVPSPDGFVTQQIIEQRLQSTTAIGDDCNPTGCVEPDTEPELGHSFRDSYGVLWRYVGGGMWQSENGDFVTYLLDIPGYREACLPTDVPFERECPPEYEGARYTDSNGIVWRWTGFNAEDEPSDHGQHWYHEYEDGTSEKRYTFQLESFFDDCPRPEGVEIQANELFVNLRVTRQLCLGSKTDVTMTAVSSAGAEISEGSITANGDDLETIDFGGGVFGAVFVPEDTGEYEITGKASDDDGNEGSATLIVTVVDCGDGTGQGEPSQPDETQPVQPDDTTGSPADETVAPTNEAPVVTVSAKPTCVEAESTGTSKVAITVTASDPDGDSLDVLLTGGSSGRQLPDKEGVVDGSGSYTTVFDIVVADRGQKFTVTATADDGQVTSSDSTTFDVRTPGGCNTTQTTTGNVQTTVPKVNTTTTTVPKVNTTTTIPQNSPGRVELTTKCVQLSAQGTGTVAFTVVDADGLKSVSVSPSTLTAKGSLSTGQYTVSPVTKDDMGKTLTINVVDGKGVSGSYRLIVPAICG